MTLDFDEWALLRGSLRTASTGQLSPQDATADLVLKGDFHSVLTSEFARELFAAGQTDADVSLAADGDVAAWLAVRVKNTLVDASAETQFNALCVGIAALHSFVQSAWTGPLLSFAAIDLFSSQIRSLDRDAVRAKTLERLESNHESAYVLTPDPLLLLIAKLILVDAAADLSALKTSPWWTYRCAFIQQRIIDNPASLLHDLIFNSLDQVGTNLPSVETERDVCTRYHVEYGLVHHYYKQDAKANPRFTLAQETSQLTWNLTGALGKRTKFQTFEVTQLVVMAESRQDADSDMDSEVKETDAAVRKPQNLPHNDDTILETIQITQTDTPVQKSLRPTDQAILLAVCMNVKNTNPMHGLTIEEMYPYVRRVLENPNNWMVHTMALLLRSRLESDKFRTVERAALQLQALVDQIVIEESPVAVRLRHFFSLLMPPKWELERELGERYVSLGVVRSALEIFERLQMWEDVVSCHQMLEQSQKAEVVVRDLLKTSPNSPKFHCLLGDIRGEISFYEEAWRLSGGRYARAMRSLGAHYFKLSNWNKAIECYELALAINPLFENSWFVMGCAAMRIDDYDKAIVAFSRVTAIDNENGEAWNNLASAYIKQRKLREAFNCLRESLRHNFDSSNVWENYLFVAVDIGEFSEAIRSFDRILTIRADKPQFKDALVDVEVLEVVVLAVASDQLDSAGEPSSRHAPKLAALLDAITAKVSTPRLFVICAQFEQSQGRLRKALDYYQKAYRSILHHPEVNTNEDVFKSLVNFTIQVADAYITLGPHEEEVRVGGSTELVCKDWAYQARQTVKTVMSRTKETYGGTEHHDRLVEKFAEVKAL
ncbi:hypothetical protein BC831DRAFT_458966 [Entophlyctis helioformis]|nr:hypothetical protein BC831DRAFT_458966 [Entophlyctis helioformis]